MEKEQKMEKNRWRIEIRGTVPLLSLPFVINP